MKIIVAIDDDSGMLFNKRRQSKDAVLRISILWLHNVEDIHNYKL